VRLTPSGGAVSGVTFARRGGKRLTPDGAAKPAVCYGGGGVRRCVSLDGAAKDKDL
jgi:hypothetical protein